MTIIEQSITIATCVIGTMLTRFLPFWVFSRKKQPPIIISELGRKLPLAVFGMLIVYCLKDIPFIDSQYHGIPELAGITITVLAQLIKRNMMISVLLGTGSYMAMVNYF